MKLRNLLLSLLLCSSMFISAKDVITRTDGSTIDANVEEITETTIRYRKAGNPSGPIYSIPLSTVVQVVYENGTTDTFNTTAGLPTSQSTSSTPSDEELMKYAHSQAGATDQVSDAQLLRYANMVPSTEQLYTKAKKYRLIGWIGGGVLFVASTVGVSALDLDYGHSANILAPIGCWLGAAAWCAGFNIRAHQLKNQAREMEFYSSSIIEDELMRFGDKSLTAGLSVMGNHMTHTQGYGLSLKFTF